MPEPEDPNLTGPACQEIALEDLDDDPGADDPTDDLEAVEGRVAPGQSPEGWEAPVAWAADDPSWEPDAGAEDA